MAVVTPEQTGRRRVLDAAADLFVRQGYEGTTLREIATAAGIKAGSVYHHFESKEALFVDVLHEGMRVMTEAFDAVASETTTPPVSLRNHVRAHLGAVFEHGPYTTAHVTAFYSAPEAVRQLVVPQRDEYEQRWTALVAEVEPQGDARTRRLHRLLLFGAMNATAEWYDIDGPVSLDELSAAITDQFLHGVTEPAR